jgi:16S rRNA (adenine1518-N6/adenine1519-N6)-dimethyltransferase
MIEWSTMIKVAAKKSLGQNWLVNEGVLDRIVQAAQITSGETVLEIGPGQGALTERLIAAGAKVVAVEKDRRLIEPLREKYGGRSSGEIIEADILTWEPTLSGPYKVVANIPYYLTSHLIRLMLESWPTPMLAVLMVQEEVAQRMLAAPPDMNLLALSVQLYAKPELIMRVSRGSFRPMPDVDSAVIRLTPIPCDRSENERILQLAKTFFAHKRKQMGIGQNPKARPQELSVDNWRRIAG